jgi:hypothetical protein
MCSNPAPGETVWNPFEFDRVYKLHVLWVWNYNIQFEPVLGFGFKQVLVGLQGWDRLDQLWRG